VFKRRGACLKGAARVGSPDFEVITKPHILDSEGITESRTVVLDTVYTINPGEPACLKRRGACLKSARCVFYSN
jgi:hypothetical protein